MNRLKRTFGKIKQWFLYIVINRFLYTNGLYKVYGIMKKEHLLGFVVYSPNSVYNKWQWLKSTKYHLPEDTKPQWYLLKNGL